jgi:hypothetical protein
MAVEHVRKHSSYVFCSDADAWARIVCTMGEPAHVACWRRPYVSLLLAWAVRRKDSCAEPEMLLTFGDMLKAAELLLAAGVT